MQISSLIGKTVLSRSGENFGYVLALRLTRDMKKLSCLICSDAEEEEFRLPARAISSVDDAVIASGQRVQSPTGIPCPLGRSVYTHAGEFIGRIADVDTGENPVLVVQTQDGQRRVDLSCTVMGETVIVYPSAEERHSAKSRRASAKTGKKHISESGSETKKTITSSPNPDQTASNASDPSLVEKDTRPAQTPAEQNRTTAVRFPQKYSDGVRSDRIDRANLLGRRVRKSVYDSEGKPIALAGERITTEILSRARRNNRLLALTMNTLTNLY